MKKIEAWEWLWIIAIAAVITYFAWKQFAPASVQQDISDSIDSAIDQTIALVSMNAEQQSYISDLNPAYQQVFTDFINDVQDTLGAQVLVTSGLRTLAEQQALYDEDKRNASPGNSMHNWGGALDINVTLADGTTLHKASPAADWRPVVDIATKHNLYWGGNITGYPDNVHFDTRNFMTAAQIKQLAQQQFPGTAIADIDSTQVVLPSIT